MAEDPKPRRGLFSRLFSLLLFLASVGFAVALFFIAQPQDLSDIEGYGAKAEAPKRELRTVLENAINRRFDIELGEAEINGWLKHELQLKQGGVLAKWVTLDDIAVRLEQDRAEIILVRSVFGKPFTTSMFIRIEQVQSPEGVSTTLHRDGGAYLESVPRLKKGGRFGKLVVPQGLLLLVLPTFSELGDLFSAETELGFTNMSRISITDGHLKLDPSGPEEKAGGPNGVF